MNKQKVVYSQTWEDCQTTKQALNIQRGDVVLSIASSGDNLFNLLLEEPQLIYGVDINPAQIALCELKMAAFTKLSYLKMLALLGVRKSKKRIELYQKIKHSLSPKAKAYWDQNLKDIKRGLINCGLVEGKILPIVRVILKAFFGKKGLEKLLKLKTKKQQREYADYYFKKYEQSFLGWLFKVMASNSVIRLLSYPTFPYIDSRSDLALDHLKKIAYQTDLPLGFKDNYYFHQFFFGRYLSNKLVPPYLLDKNFDHLRENMAKIKLFTGDVASFLKRQPREAIDKFNFSDIFEPWCPEKEFVKILAETKRVGKNNARVFFREQLGRRKIPLKLKENFCRKISLEKSLLAKDKTFTYYKFNIFTIKK